jgi:Caspase domain
MADASLPAGSRAVLIGVSSYEHAGFLPIRAARNSLQEMQLLLADPELCGWPGELITVIADPSSATDLAVRIAELTETATGVLLLYYVGHGMLSARGELCLTVASTRLDLPEITGLRWDTIAGVLRTCPARTRLGILDCCYAGQAIEALGADDDQALADLTHISGVYTLTATTRNRPAHVPAASQQDNACTSFTGEFRDLIRSGIPGKPARLTFGDIYPELRRRLRAKGLPVPSQRGTDTAQQFPFTANAASCIYPTATAIRLGGDRDHSREAILDSPEPVRVGGPPQARILTDALRAAEAIADEYSKARTLIRIAEAAAAIDPDRAEDIAASISLQGSKEAALFDIAKVVSATDPDRAERIAQSMTTNGGKAELLSYIAKTVAATDPGRAARLADLAEHSVQPISSRKAKVWLLSCIAAAVATTDPDRAARLADRAERITKLIIKRETKARALAGIAYSVAATDPDRAMRITRSITPNEVKQDALAGVARELAATDPDRAMRITRSISFDETKGWALAHIAEAVAATDPDRAEDIARSIAHEPAKVSALTRVARMMAATDPGHAARLISRAEHTAQSIQSIQSITGKWSEEHALAGSAEAVAITDPDRAVRITESITGQYWKGQALTRIAEAVATTDPDRAVRIAQLITEADSKASALAGIARAVGASQARRNNAT